MSLAAIEAEMDRWMAAYLPRLLGADDIEPDVLAEVKGRWEAWRKEMDASEPRGPFRDY